MKIVEQIVLLIRPRNNYNKLTMLPNNIVKSNSDSNRINLKYPLLTELYKAHKISDLVYDQSIIKLDITSESEDLYILNNNIADSKDLTIAKSHVYKIPYVDLSKFDVNRIIVNKIPIDLAKENNIIAYDIYTENDLEILKIAISEPLENPKVRFLSNVLNKPISIYIAEPKLIAQIIQNKYDSDNIIKADVDSAINEIDDDIYDISAENKDSTKITDIDISNAPVSRIVNLILEFGVQNKSSDCHIEPRENSLIVRFRVNGILIEKLKLPMQLANNITTRIKILSDLKIDEHRIPQDGRFEAKFAEKHIDMRVSTMPTVFGEKIVIRFLDKTSGVFPLESTGLRGDAYSIYKNALTNTQGIILVTGPTGSGKTVTLSSSLGILNRPEVNIVTLEDPVEIRIPGVNQVNINNEVGLTFSTGLRSFLRQDPDIIMVGEIRDQETAGLATQAALVGRLVLASLHTNSASGAIPRLLNMGIEPFLLSSVINVIVAQRLPRTLCDNCKTSHIASSVQVEILKRNLSNIPSFDLYSYTKSYKLSKHIDLTSESDILLFEAKGCEKCNGTGFNGRIGIFEVLKMDNDLAKLVVNHATVQEIENLAISKGMLTMLQDGFIKALEGITTIEEIIRVQN